MSAAKIVGLTSGPIWGVPNTTYGAGMSADYEKGGDVTDLKDGNSRIIAASFSANKNTLSYRAKIKGTIPTNARGTQLTIDGVTAYLDKITRTKQEGDFAEVQIDLIEYPDFTS